MTKNIVRATILSLLYITICWLAACGSNNNIDDTPSLNPKVIMIGDSYFAVGEYIATELEHLSGEIYRHYYMGGATLGYDYLGITSIPNQYVKAHAENAEISTVIMDGGGNDVLLGGTTCSDADSVDCTTIIDASTAIAETLVTQMQNDGVTNVIYLFYPHLINNMAWVNDALDYAYTQASTICIAAQNCFLVNSIDAFEGHPEYFLSDNLHPNETGGKVLAGLIWQVMQDNGIEQNQH